MSRIAKEIIDKIRGFTATEDPTKIEYQPAYNKQMQFVKKLLNKGIEVVVNNNPVFEYRDMKILMRQFFLEDESQFDGIVDGNVEVVFLGKWVVLKVDNTEDRELIRIAWLTEADIKRESMKNDIKEMKNFVRDLRNLRNKYAYLLERPDTGPDYITFKCMMGCLKAFDEAAGASGRFENTKKET